MAIDYNSASPSIAVGGAGSDDGFMGHVDTLPFIFKFDATSGDLLWKKILTGSITNRYFKTLAFR